MALVTLISSQIMMLSEGNTTGLAKKEAFLDLDFMQKLNK